MSVVVKIPTQLRSASGGEAETVLDGATVQEVLDGLFERFEELRARIVSERIRRGVSQPKWWVCIQVLKPVAAEAAAIAQPAHMRRRISLLPKGARPPRRVPPGAVAAHRRDRRPRPARRAPRSARGPVRGRSRAGPGAPRPRGRCAGTASRTGPA